MDNKITDATMTEITLDGTANGGVQGGMNEEVLDLNGDTTTVPTPMGTKPTRPGVNKDDNVELKTDFVTDEIVTEESELEEDMVIEEETPSDEEVVIPDEQEQTQDQVQGQDQTQSNENTVDNDNINDVDNSNAQDQVQGQDQTQSNENTVDNDNVNDVDNNNAQDQSQSNENTVDNDNVNDVDNNNAQDQSQSNENTVTNDTDVNNDIDASSTNNNNIEINIEVTPEQQNQKFITGVIPDGDGGFSFVYNDGTTQYIQGQAAQNVVNNYYNITDSYNTTTETNTTIDNSFKQMIDNSVTAEEINHVAFGDDATIVAGNDGQVVVQDGEGNTVSEMQDGEGNTIHNGDTITKTETVTNNTTESTTTNEELKVEETEKDNPPVPPVNPEPEVPEIKEEQNEEPEPTPTPEPEVPDVKEEQNEEPEPIQKEPEEQLTIPDTESGNADEQHNFFQGLMNIAYEKFHFPVAALAAKYGWVDKLHDWGYDIPGYEDPANGYFADDYKKNKDEYDFSMKSYDEVMTENEGVQSDGINGVEIGAAVDAGAGESFMQQNGVVYDYNAESAYINQTYTSFDGTSTISGEEFKAQLFAKLDNFYAYDANAADSSYNAQLALAAQGQGAPVEAIEASRSLVEKEKAEFQTWYSSLSKEEQMGVTALSAEWSQSKQLTYEEAVEKVEKFEYSDEIEAANSSMKQSVTKYGVVTAGNSMVLRGFDSPEEANAAYSSGNSRVEAYTEYVSNASDEDKKVFTDAVNEVGINNRLNILSDIGIQSNYLVSALAVETDNPAYVQQYISNQANFTDEFVNQSRDFYMYTAESAANYDKHVEGKSNTGYDRYMQAVNTLGFNIDIEVDTPESPNKDNQKVPDFDTNIVDETTDTGFDNGMDI